MHLSQVYMYIGFTVATCTKEAKHLFNFYKALAERRLYHSYVFDCFLIVMG